MAESAKLDVEVSKPGRKGGKGPLVMGLAGLLLFGGGGFYAVWSGMLALPGGETKVEPEISPLATTEFVPIEELTVSLGPTAGARFLRMSATLEVEPGRAEEVKQLMPRILDVINTYLQALDESDIERPAAMTRMRAHLLRRIRIVAGEGRVRDLLITEFILQ